MSCRVLGRGAEDTLIAKLAEAAKSLGCDEIRGRYIATSKNAMVKDFYRRFNFRHEPQNDEWFLRITEAPRMPENIDAILLL
jgi:predicted enzyme involved in methoxymalonyl-ACP biosynthesis